MQHSNLQKDKADLTAWIAQLQDKTVIEQLKQLMQTAKEQGNFTLTNEQKNMVSESAARYLSAEDPGHTWDEVQHDAITSFYTLSEEQKDSIENDRKHTSGEEPGAPWEDVKKRLLKNLDGKKT